MIRMILFLIIKKIEISLNLTIEISAGFMTENYILIILLYATLYNMRMIYFRYVLIFFIVPKTIVYFAFSSLFQYNHFYSLIHHSIGIPEEIKLPWFIKFETSIVTIWRPHKEKINSLGSLSTSAWRRVYDVVENIATITVIVFVSHFSKRYDLSISLFGG